MKLKISGTSPIATAMTSLSSIWTSAAANSNSKTMATVAVTTVAVAFGAYALYRGTKKSKPDNKLIPPASQPKDIDALIQERFTSCVQHMKGQLRALSQPMQLEFYALYKQATMGDAKDFYSKSPPTYDMVATAKFNAWTKLDQMARTQAMQAYIDKAVHMEFTRTMLTDEDDGDLEGDAVLDIEGMGIRQSTLAGVEETAENKAAEAAADQKFPLHAAARQNQVAALQALLEQSDNTYGPNDLDEAGQTALHLAADAGHPDCIHLLVKYGADVQAADHDGISVLQAAVIGGNVETCRLLCVLGANPDQPDMDGDTPRECAQDDPVLQDLLFRASTGQLEIDEEFQKELNALGSRNSAANLANMPETIKEETDS